MERTIRRELACAVIVSALGLLAAPVHAQTPSANEAAQAREQARLGLAAARENHWVDARAAFERAYALNPQPLARLNLAGAQAQTGQLVAAAESYREFLRTASESDARAYAEAARRSLAQAERRIAHLRILATGLSPGDTLALDAQPLSLTATEAALPVDPGAHRVSAAREGREVAHAEATLAEGSTASVTLTLPAVIPAASVLLPSASRAPVPRRTARVPVPAPPARTGGSPWPWIATIAGVVLVGGAVTAVVFATAPQAPDATQPLLGNVPPMSVEVR